jgi:hypothetical protein
MALYEQITESEAASSSAPASSPSSSIKSLGRRIAMWLNTCADYWTAAALYDELRGLSDAELQRRGLSRDTLARDVCSSCDRTGGH